MGICVGAKRILFVFVFLDALIGLAIYIAMSLSFRLST